MYFHVWQITNTRRFYSYNLNISIFNHQTASCSGVKQRNINSADFGEHSERWKVTKLMPKAAPAASDSPMQGGYFAVQRKIMKCPLANFHSYEKYLMFSRAILEVKYQKK